MIYGYAKISIIDLLQKPIVLSLAHRNPWKISKIR